MAMVELKGISKTFGRVQALQDVTFSVNKGEVFGFIGPNGSGKSTTIRVLLGMIKASTGTAEIFGQDVWKQAPVIHRNTAYVPGDVHLWPNLTGGEVIDLLIELGGGGDRNKRDQLIDRFQLDPTKKCRTYSKGNRQKVALIGAFASFADLYLFDEPTSGLDPLMERIFQECVREIRAEGKSVLLSSHILSEVEKLCDRVGIIRDGTMIETGSLSDLRHLTRMTMEVETKRDVVSLEKQAGVYDVKRESSKLTFQVDTEHSGAVIAYLTEFGIKHLESRPPTLEDLFLRYYEEGRQAP